MMPQLTGASPSESVWVNTLYLPSCGDLKKV